MKISKVPTNYILVEAENNDDYVTVTHCIVKLSDNLVHKWFDWDVDMQILKKANEEFITAEFRCKTSVWFIDEEIKSFKGGCAYIDITEEKIEKLNTPDENSIEGFSISLGGYQDITVKGMGKYSGIEYWTSELDITQLMKDRKQLKTQ